MGAQHLGAYRPAAPVAWLALLLAIIVAAATGAGAQSLDSLTDDVTGIRLGVPLALVGKPTRATWGSNWRAPGGRLSIDTLNFGSKRTLIELRETLGQRSGRTLDVDQLASDRLDLRGIDRDGTHFIVRILQRGSELRGLSIVYSRSAKDEMAPVADAVLASFVAFPEAGPPVRPSPGQRQDVVEADAPPD
jgi:hypothetical protein